MPARAADKHLRQKAGDQAPGFTLLEVLVTLAVLGLLVTGLLQGSQFVTLGWHRQARLLEGNEDLDAVDRTLRHLIEQARPGTEWEPLVFAGTAHAVAFTSVVPVTVTEMAPRRADVELIVNDGHRLLLLWTTHLHAIRTGLPPRPNAAEILQGVERIELSYLPATPGASWIQVWHESAPPRLVRIRIVFSSPGHPRWPDILAAPMLDPP